MWAKRQIGFVTIIWQIDLRDYYQSERECIGYFGKTTCWRTFMGALIDVRRGLST